MLGNLKFNLKLLVSVFIVESIYCVPVQQREDYGDYTTTIQSISTESPQYDTQDLSNTLTSQLVWNFFSNSTNSWSDYCGSTSNPVVWQVAIAGKVMTNSGDSHNIQRAIMSLNNYKNSTGAFSASMNKDSEVYTDDDAQVSWVFTDAYHQTQYSNSLDTASGIIDIIQHFENQGGGILWSVEKTYIASISTLEGGLAALKYSKESYDPSLVSFAKNCTQWVLDNLVDDSDGFIMDGIYVNNGVLGGTNTGKLTYTIGVMISSCAYLSSLGDISHDWKAIAVEFGVKFISGGTLNNQFFSNGHINDQIERSHVLFVGLSDLLKMTSPIGSYQESAYSAFSQLLVRESRYLRDTYPEVFSGGCPGGDYNTLIKYASLAQVFNSVSDVVDRV